MTDSWFERLEGEVRHAAGHFRHAGPSITAGEPQPPPTPGDRMALADTAATLEASHASALAELQDLLVKGHDVVDNHMTQIAAAIQDVSAVASMADHPGVVAMVSAVTHVPATVLEPFIDGLSALAKAFPPPAAEAPAEPAPEPQAA